MINLRQSSKSGKTPEFRFSSRTRLGKCWVNARLTHQIMKSNWNLPPGTLASDVSPRMVVCDNGCIRGELPVFDGDGEYLWQKDCPRCSGTGEITEQEAKGE